jgi:hypothetical protein
MDDHGNSSIETQAWYVLRGSPTKKETPKNPLGMTNI